MHASLAGQRVLITGASGLVGRRLAAELHQAGATVVAAVRRPVDDPARELFWDPQRGEIDVSKLDDVDAVVHLAGENVARGRWTASFKRKIRESRVNGTRLISEALARRAAKPQAAGGRPSALVCASAIGYYGDRGDETLIESSPPGDDFLARVCQEWEAACQPARDAGIRTVNARIGVVLSAEGGALAKMLTPFKLGAGGKVGHGRQYMSWIAIDDVARAIAFLLANADVSGPVNVTAPRPVTNAQFAQTLGRVLRRPAIVPLPAFAARLLFGEMADALLLSSTRVMPQALAAAGFQFQYGELEGALRRLVGR
ncbi:MAG: TIGR01777 family protein [Planctomycetota bacterium]|nr:MAG: TIGR01777 family protein [Planctomycetota bacterium]